MSGDLFQSILSGNVAAELESQFPFFPLNSPGMPLPGPNFIAAAAALGDPPPVIEKQEGGTVLTSSGPALHYLYRRALYDENFTITVDVRGLPTQAPMVPGHLLGDYTNNMNGGPRAAKVMIIGKNPGREEVQNKANLTGPTAEVFMDALQELGVHHTTSSEWYVTNLIKWPILDEQSDTLPAAHKKDNAILLHQEIQLVKPDYILCLGSDASKALLGTAYGVSAMVGRVQNYTIPVYVRGQDVRYHTAKVMAATHPAAVFRTPEKYPEFRDQIALFLQLTSGAEVGGKERFIRHVNVYKHRHLKQIVDEIRNDPNPLRRIIAVDGEWEGELPENAGAYLRTVQFSSAHGEGITVVLRHQGGEPAFQPSIEHAISELRRLLQPDPEAGYVPRVGGHFFRADLPWLIHAGLDLRESYAPPDAYQKCRDEGGWDTGLMYHAVNETASYRLTDMTVRLTTAPVYDVVLKQHITDYCNEHDIKKEDLEGYGFLPPWILHPEPRDPEWGFNYANYDADVTRRIAMRMLQPGGDLDADWNGLPSWEPYWRSHLASLGVLEMEMTGIKVDKNRVDRLTTLFIQVRNKLLAGFREAINWPDFNPDSSPQCVAFLFGDEYSKKRDKQTGQQLSIRPPGAMTLGLQPVKSTGKRSKLWADLLSRNQAHLYTPCADKEVLGILGHEHKLAMQLRDLKFILQILKSTLRPPNLEADGVSWQTDAGGNLVYSKGMAANAHDDGRVHTHISQNKETGRGACSRPPLQAISKRREGDYARILGSFREDKRTGERTAVGDYLDIFGTPVYAAPIRTIFVADEDHLLVEADFTGAELAVIAWLSNDATMIEHVRRNGLPEGDPMHYDIHSQTAVKAFRLQCEPTKHGLADIGKSPLRVAAKNVNFGIPYGRSAEAIARQCREEGVDVTIDECQQMIDFYFEQYPGTANFLQECRDRSQSPGWVAGSFGRMRRFIRTRERSVIKEQERQAQNFPIQNTVADALWLAIHNFHKYKKEHTEANFRMQLPIHDALLFEVPVVQVRDFVTHILPKCMVHDVPIWPRRLDNTPMAVSEPYHFSIDIEIQEHWGEKLPAARREELGIADLC